MLSLVLLKHFLKISSTINKQFNSFTFETYRKKNIESNNKCPQNFAGMFRFCAREETSKRAL